MNYAILGPLEVHSHGRPVEVARPRRRAVLAFLLLHANRRVSIDQLVDALWAEGPPRTARAQVHTAVSALRGGLPEELAGQLSSEAAGYRLHVAEGALDSAEFRLRLARARGLAERHQHVEAVRTLRDGLSLWRGAALTGVDAPFAGPAGVRLEEERFAAHELLADLEMRAGRHQELVPELTALSDQYPARESIAERLALALYRSGRQADALAVVSTLRKLLAEEYGLDLGRRLVELEAAVLRGDTALQHSAAPSEPAPAPAPRSSSDVPRPAQLPRPPAGFVGRSAELASLSLLLDPTAGEARIAVVNGPAGVGKTALALSWAHSRLAEFPDGQLFVDLHGYDRADPEVPGRVLERFLMALGVPGYQVPADLSQREDLYRSSMADRRVLLVLDNAHDYQQIRSLLPGSASCLTLVTSRGKLGGLVADTGAASVPLGMLPIEEAVEVLGRIAGADRVAATPDAARDLARLCGGLPLALRISAVRLVEDPATPLSGLAAELTPEEDRLAGLGLPGDDHTVSRALDHTCMRLTADQARLFQLLGLHPGASIGSAAAEALSGTGELLRGSASPRVRQTLRELDAVHLLDQAGPDRYSMHDLVRLYSRESGLLSATERDAALTRMFEWYISVGTAAQDLVQPGSPQLPGDLRHVWRGPAPFEDHDGALDWFDQELANLTSLIQLASARDDHRVVWQLSASLARYLTRRHRLDTMLETQRLGERAARAVGNELAAATLAGNQAIAYSMRHDPQAREPFERAITTFVRLGELRRAALARLNLGNLEYMLGRLAEACTIQTEGVAAAREAGDDYMLLRALGALGLIRSDLGDHEEARGLLTEALAVAEASGNEHMVDTTRGQLALVLVRLGEFEEALTLGRKSLAAARRDGNPMRVGHNLDEIGLALAGLGRHAEARESWREAAQVLASIGSPQAEEVAARLAEPEPASEPGSSRPDSG
ncbi:BTAD domain-containing putative transcriptional regulator [Kitasatospora sp. MAP5-34]|uniref:AfsR/SARP family transcriptional regulator n=1 Tax=Kitasatospora sp. MAP5-34 TaxID=3035102 RepID=UPI00247562E1|nr:BTAD domain-containing putative transcriptional regulator [Kitasatospora sp. MAP5-34]